MIEWKDINTVEDIPKPGTWDQYEWRGDIYMIKTAEVFIPKRYIVESNGDITFIKAYTYINVSYRPKPYPTDEYIEAHLWETNHGTWANAKDIQLYHGSRWFFTARHIPKSAIKMEVSE